MALPKYIMKHPKHDRGRISTKRLLSHIDKGKGTAIDRKDRLGRWGKDEDRRGEDGNDGL